MDNLYPQILAHLLCQGLILVRGREEGRGGLQNLESYVVNPGVGKEEVCVWLLILKRELREGPEQCCAVL